MLINLIQFGLYLLLEVYNVLLSEDEVIASIISKEMMKDTLNSLKTDADNFGRYIFRDKGGPKSECYSSVVGVNSGFNI